MRSGLKGVWLRWQIGYRPIFLKVSVNPGISSSDGRACSPPAFRRTLMSVAQRAVAAALVASVFFYASSRTRAERICRKVGNGTWNGRNNQNDRIGHWGRIALGGWAFRQRFSRQRLWGHLWEIELGTIVMNGHVPLWCIAELGV
jgi:hypothetical protein